MPLSRLVGYYCLLMGLCGLVFVRWLPVEACQPASMEICTEAPPPVTHKSPFAPKSFAVKSFAAKASLLVTLRPPPLALLPGK